MNIEFNRPIMIFRKDFDNGSVYRIGVSKKTQDGTYQNGYIDCRFKNDVTVENQTKISVNSAWLSFYINKDGKTIPYVFINEFAFENSEDFLNSLGDSVTYETTEEQIQIDDLELPFE